VALFLGRDDRGALWGGGAIDAPGRTWEDPPRNQIGPLASASQPDSDLHQSAKGSPVPQNGPRPKPVNACFFMFRYELRCWARFSWLCLKSALILAVCGPLTLILLPFLFWALPVIYPLVVLYNLKQGWPADKALALLALGNRDKRDKLLEQLPIIECRRWRAYEKAKKGEPLTTDVVGSIWTDKLHAAIVNLDLEGVKTALSKGASPSALIDGDELTPFLLVALVGRRNGNAMRSEKPKEIAEALLAAGGGVDAEAFSRVLSACAEKGSPLFFLFFDQPGAIEATSFGASLPVLRAAAQGLSPAIWRKILEVRPSLSNATATSEDQGFPSLDGHNFGDFQRQFVGDRTRTEPIEGNQPLHFLAMASESHLDSVAWRLTRASTGVWDEEIKPIDALSRRAISDCLALLLASGADLEARGFGGRTPLLQAVWHGSFHVATLLLDAGAKAGARDNAGRAALDLLPTIIKPDPSGPLPPVRLALAKRLALAMEREAIEEAANEAAPAGVLEKRPDGPGPLRL
jgi:hypothetical protein